MGGGGFLPAALPSLGCQEAKRLLLIRSRGYGVIRRPTPERTPLRSAGYFGWKMIFVPVLLPFALAIC